MPDHFSTVAAQYAASRPTYPESIARWLAEQAPARELAWDCGTGSGQAAVLIAQYFTRVVATDLSGAQLRHATPHPRVEYRQAPERASGLPERSCDLVTIAQAAHWFDLPAFYAEVERVLKPDGVLALWGYAVAEIASEIDPLVAEFTFGRVGKYWPPGRELAMDRYRTIARTFPYPLIEAPQFTMERDWTSGQFLEFVRSWSAVDRCRAAEGRDPVDEIAPTVGRLWGGASRGVRWPIHMLVGRPASARR